METFSNIVGYSLDICFPAHDYIGLFWLYDHMLPYINCIYHQPSYTNGLPWLVFAMMVIYLSMSNDIVLWYHDIAQIIKTCTIITNRLLAFILSFIFLIHRGS